MNMIPQKHVFNNAGCFCPECVDKFRRYLKEKEDIFACGCRRVERI